MGDTPAGFKERAVNDLTSGQIGADGRERRQRLRARAVQPRGGTCTPLRTASTRCTRPRASTPAFRGRRTATTSRTRTRSGTSTSAPRSRAPAAMHRQRGRLRRRSPSRLTVTTTAARRELLLPRADNRLHRAEHRLRRVVVQPDAWPGTGQPIEHDPDPIEVQVAVLQRQQDHRPVQPGRIRDRPDRSREQRSTLRRGAVHLQHAECGPQCQNPPSTDDSTATNVQQAFYPIFSTVLSTGWLGQCAWAEGGANQQKTINNFGGTSTRSTGRRSGSTTR